MCITEYNEAETMQLFKEQERREGRIEGRGEGIRGTVEILRDLGVEDTKIRSAIKQQYDLTDEMADSYL